MLTRTPIWLRWIYPKLTWTNPGKGKTITLTFDDGPHPEITPWVMDQLESRGFRGTFFCIGDNVRKYPETYQSILDRGHATGNHTFNHLKGFRTPKAVYMDNILNCASLVQSNLFRPPYGRITPGQVRMLSDSMHIVMWSLLAEDWNPRLDRQKKLHDLQRLTRPGDIVVFHDSEKAVSNLKVILPAYLDFLKSSGYQSRSL